MGENKLRFAYLYIILAAYWGYCFFVSVVKPPFLAYYTFDETFIADSGVFLWYGMTPRILDWPASPSVLLYGIIFGVSVFFQTLAHLGELTGILDVFTLMDKAAFDYLSERQPYILAGRAIRLLIVLAVMGWTLRFLQKQRHPLLEGANRWLIGVVILTSHLIWNNGVVLRPETISSVLFIHVLCRLFFSEKLERKDIVTLSVLFGITGAERLIFLILSPLFFGGILLLAGPARWKTLRYSLGVFLLSFLAFCPFVLTDPLIIAKAFFGGILAKVNDSPMETYFNWEFILTYFENPVGYLAFGLTLLGIWRMGKEKNLFYGLVVANWFLFLFLVLKSAKIYDPHVLPAALVNLLVMALGLCTLRQMLDNRKQWVAAVIAALFVAGEAYTIVAYHTWVRRDTNIYDAYKWIQNEIPSGSRVLVNIEVGLLLNGNRNTMDRQIAANDNIQNQLNKLGYLMGLNQHSRLQLDEETFPISASAFAFEDEKLFGLQYRLLRKYGDDDTRKRFDLDMTIDDNTLFYHGILPEVARERFQRGEYEYWVTDQQLENLQPVREFADSDGAPLRVYKAVVPPS